MRRRQGNQATTTQVSPPPAQPISITAAEFLGRIRAYSDSFCRGTDYPKREDLQALSEATVVLPDDPAIRPWVEFRVAEAEAYMARMLGKLLQ